MTDQTTADPIVAPQTVYQVKDFVDAAQLKKDLAYSPHNLTDAMMTQAAMFSHYGVLHAESSHQVDVVKMLLENTSAAVYKIIADENAKSGTKVTVPMMDSLVARNSRVVGMKRALNAAKRVEVITKTAVEAFRHRRDMLIQHGLISREEMKGNLSIAERNIREDVDKRKREDFMESIKARSKESAEE